MTPFSGFLLSLALIIGSLTTLLIVNKKEARQKARDEWLRGLTRRCEDLENVAIDAESLLNDKDILAAIATEIVAIYQLIYDEEGKAKHLEMRLSRAKQNLEHYQQGAIARELCRVQENDVGVAKAISLVDNVHEVLSTAAKRGAIKPDLRDEMMSKLDYTRFCIEIVSIIAQGHKLYEEEDFVSANSHYYHALKQIESCKLTDPRIAKFESEIKELLSRERTFLSEELMSETQFNPKPQEKAKRVKAFSEKAEGPPHQQVN